MLISFFYSFTFYLELFYFLKLEKIRKLEDVNRKKKRTVKLFGLEIDAFNRKKYY
jgi:hypothetical protein